MTWLSREGAHTRDGHTLRVVRWLKISPMLPFPDTYGGKLATLQYYQRPDRGKLNIL